MGKIYCLRCNKQTENKNQRVPGTSNGRIMCSANCKVCDKRNNLTEKQESRGLLGIIGRIPIFVSL